MSTDDRRVFGRRLPGGTEFEHPLVGLERRRTAVVAAYLAVLVGLFGVSYAGTTITIGDTPLETVTPRFDAVSTVLIALATATITVVPFCYAAWNGGPAVSFGLPLVPVFLGDIAAGRYVLGVDAAIALTVGAAASALALLATDVRQTGSLRPWRGARGDAAGSQQLFVTMILAVAAVGVARFAGTVPPRSLEWYLPFAVCWLVSVGVVGAYWQATLRAAVASRVASERAES
ncbi:hypothetical protein CV102_05125 [Natronococcus pandeyae]|uniref:Uncharacterized protein n=1 Tax=Natronococcus pandeyae TaxID=2055836 RepID=A0A8J8Q3E6_9EURY|nr:hypothetical protein [Natronococcus pandeyae]TYL39671.1 hypothetical protein CV102_05125 [Natronococcus pandeyae]